jgi:gluconokinase
MGVAGAGKTTVGRRLADVLGWPFLDADDFHSVGNILKMTRGEALTDADRAPWLADMHAALAHAVANGAPVVLAASVLKRLYRHQLAGDLPGIRFVYLEASPELIAHRLTHRPDHFMKAEMLAGQFAVLETPADALVVDADRPIEEIVTTILFGFDQAPANPQL